MRRITRSTWILIGGFAVAGVVLAAGVLNTHRLQSRADDARAKCDPYPPGTSVPARDLPADLPTKPATLEDIILSTHTQNLDPEFAKMLAASQHAEVVKACYAKLGAPDDDAIAVTATRLRLLVALTAIAGAVPWAWYFLLRGITELRGETGGNPPAGGNW